MLSTQLSHYYIIYCNLFKKTYINHIHCVSMCLTEFFGKRKDFSFNFIKLMTRLMEVHI